MNSCDRILQSLAKKHQVFISDLRMNPVLRKRAMQDLYHMKKFPMQETAWQRAMYYLTKGGTMNEQ